MSDKRIFPGFGKSWGEERATGILPRFLQRMREPATKSDWFAASVGALIGLAIIISAF